mmetsp:Transcript_18261/g.52092  ORF Transcript_18261/g.52092 Transcript_18261/m.52092 type:complete len:229 (-) Transcript_18261:1258-1944(-)
MSECTRWRWRGWPSWTSRWSAVGSTGRRRRPLRWRTSGSARIRRQAAERTDGSPAFISSTRKVSPPIFVRAAGHPSVVVGRRRRVRLVVRWRTTDARVVRRVHSHAPMAACSSSRRTVDCVWRRRRRGIWVGWSSRPSGLTVCVGDCCRNAGKRSHAAERNAATALEWILPRKIIDRHVVALGQKFSSEAVIAGEHRPFHLFRLLCFRLRSFRKSGGLVVAVVLLRLT